jgi:hypothetical protein
MILETDKALFHLINVNMDHPVMDFIFVWIRHPLFWVPLYIFTLAFLLFNYQKRGYMLLICSMIVFGVSDIVSSRIIKPTVARLRPCNQDDLYVIERVRCGAGYSFTSTHATNHFALATFFALTLGGRIRKIRPWLWSWAGLVSFAQIYVGVHFPIDIIGGTVLGILIGWGCSILYERHMIAKWLI